MKILLDPQIFNDQVYGGISRYYTEVFSHLKVSQSVAVELPICFTRNVYLKQSKLYSTKQKQYTFYLTFLSKIGISIRKLSRKINTKQALASFEKGNYDLFIPTYFNPYFLEHIHSKPFVLTVYDMIHELFPHYFPDDTTTSSNKLMLMEKATKIIAVSHNTKRDIIKIYPHIDASKIHVIYHGNSIQVFPNATIEVPDNYVLFVGVRANYKNFFFLVKSMVPLFEKDPSLHLVCAGGGTFNEVENEFLKSLGLQNKVLQKNFEDHQLGLFYQKAKCFVFPSEYEGFGIPVLEAMACGCPIVLTNRSSFPEVAGEAGLFFEWNNSEDLRHKVALLLQDEALRLAYIQKGHQQIQKFNWADAANQCLDVYQKAVINN